MYYQANKNQQILNVIKIISVHLLHVLLLLSIFKYFRISLNFLLIYFTLFYILLLSFVFFLKNWLLLLFSHLILKDRNQEKFLLDVETVSQQLGLEGPRVFILNIESFVFLSLGFSKKSGYFFIVGKNLLKNNQLNLTYILANQLYLISSLETALITNLIIVFAWPVLFLDLIMSKLKKYYLDVLKIVIGLFTIPFYFYSYIFFYFLISKNRIFMADYSASKLQRSVQGFSDTLEIFRVAPKLSREYIPKILTPLLFAKIPGTYFSFAPEVEERIQYIKSIIG